MPESIDETYRSVKYRPYSHPVAIGIVGYLRQQQVRNLEWLIVLLLILSDSRYPGDRLLT